MDRLPAAGRPLSRPVLATLAIYNGLNVWNNFLLPLVLTQSSSVAVLPLGLTKLEGLYSINVPAVMAGVLLSVLPLLILFVLMRRQVMNSLGSIRHALNPDRALPERSTACGGRAVIPARPGNGGGAFVARLGSWRVRTL